MAVTRLSVKSFTVFDKLDLELVDGINVIIGENGTGKTQILKLLYVAHCMLERAFKHGRGSRTHSASFLMERLSGVFRVDEQLQDLVRKRRRSARVKLEHRRPAGYIEFDINSDGGVGVNNSGRQVARGRALFIPAREWVSLADDGFVGIYRRSPLLDETVFDLCAALEVKTSTSTTDPSLNAAARIVREAIDGRIVRRQKRFFYESGDTLIGVHLAAEGHRKLGEVARLVANGTIEPGSFLLWDEPEANLNPVLMRSAVKMLERLASAGVQIVLATHDYLLSQSISLLGEFPRPGTPKVRFFGLRRARKRGPVVHERGDTIGELVHNPILAEHARQYEIDIDAEERAHTNGTGVRLQR
jgi:predicted ATPase